MLWHIRISCPYLTKPFQDVTRVMQNKDLLGLGSKMTWLGKDHGCELKQVGYFVKIRDRRGRAKADWSSGNPLLTPSFSRTDHFLEYKIQKRVTKTLAIPLLYTLKVTRIRRQSGYIVMDMVDSQWKKETNSVTLFPFALGMLWCQSQTQMLSCKCHNWKAIQAVSHDIGSTEDNVKRASSVVRHLTHK